MGVGSVASSATLVLLTALEFMTLGEPLSTTLYTWINVGGFSPLVSFYVDGLTLTMLSVITGVGLLIHIYSSLFMLDEKDYSRFFSYMNLFVSAMLVLVLADNLLLLFVGWEGVGLCSYLLVGILARRQRQWRCSKKSVHRHQGWRHSDGDWHVPVIRASRHTRFYTNDCRCN